MFTLVGSRDQLCTPLQAKQRGAYIGLPWPWLQLGIILLPQIYSEIEQEPCPRRLTVLAKVLHQQP
jgi:hypothetical protein